MLAQNLATAADNAEQKRHMHVSTSDSGIVSILSGDTRETKASGPTWNVDLIKT